MGYKGFGDDLSKWYIAKDMASGRWVVCPALRDKDFNGLPHDAGASFTTGAEALAAFAAGGPA